MKEKKLKSLIDIAIERELKACGFYKDLADRVEDPTARDTRIFLSRAEQPNLQRKGGHIFCNRSVAHAYFFCFLLSLLALMLLPVTARAHAPNDVALQYNSGSQTLNVTISHTVSNPQKHYIKTVTITKNGETAATYEYTSQPAPSSYTYTYSLEAKTGDTLKVTADCIYFGSKTGELAIGK